jgi:hypothetical protein
MDSNKLISLSKKLSPMLKGKPLSTICGLIMSETHYQPVKEVLSGEEILILTFLIKGQNQTNDTNLLYKQAISSMVKLLFFPFMSTVQATTFPSIYPFAESIRSKLLASNPSASNLLPV